MKKHALVLLLLVPLFSFFVVSGDLGAAEPKGAKALFFSGEGTTLSRTSDVPAPAPARRAESRVASQSKVKYMGVSYWIEKLGKDGEMKRVNSSTVFRQGDRIRVSLKSNRDGYLYVINLGSTGRSTMLFPNASSPDGSNLVTANQAYDIPPNNFFRFDENPGEETLLVMLSPTPMDTGMPGMKPQPQVTTSAAPPPPQFSPPAPSAGLTPPADSLGQPLPPPQFSPPAPSAGLTPPDDATGQPLPPYPSSDVAEQVPQSMEPPQMMASAEGSKGMPRGSKDLLIEDLTVKARTRAIGQKDLYVEEDRGPRAAYYAVAPVSSMEQENRFISLQIKLKHR